MAQEQTIEAKIINDWLSSGPCVPLRTDPLFRLVWSNDQRELRKGTFTDWQNGIKIREYQSTEQVYKYNYILNRWVLEQWFPPEVCLNPELPDSIHGSYEPIYVFEDKDGNSLPLVLRVVQIIVRNCLLNTRSTMLRRSEDIARREKVEQIAYNKDMDMLSDEGPLVSQLHDGSAVLNAMEKKDAL